ncbi:uncharacterized protein MONBRDRAFT_10122 [Monosiga brevicollis MX1]|uniref:Ankyrin repeat domain-containing protein n=1 Tax=Monosiga brevicollis TaxID=81824 RepID=A9V5A1_MONBE|nr:uncharacterized protein MONBRDRAFT_10122 [Monosiga brevicollis MX1]EDQ87241.1 predicted protein [Monosiga brevicollis MX1]|eukprot:XP_001747854.1 hypothetical protein [Monosiga brevicollis MX1]
MVSTHGFALVVVGWLVMLGPQGGAAMPPLVRQNDQTQKNYVTSFFRAASLNDVATMEKIWSAHPEVLQATGPMMRTALHFAALSNASQSTIWLLDHQVDLDVRERYGVTALMYAAQVSSLSVMAILLDRGADIDAKNHNHWRPLHYAARYDHVLALQLLIQRGANPALINRTEKVTALGLAQRFQKQNAVAYLEQVMSTASRS